MKSISQLAIICLAAFAACSGSNKGGATGVGGIGVGGTGVGGTGTGGTGTGGTGTGGTGTGGTGPAPGSPTVTSFTAEPATLPAGGGPVTLTWAVTGADQISIDNGVGVVTGTSVKATVTATTIFTLSAMNAKGTTTKSAVVTVSSSSKNPVILSFSATPASLPTGGGQTTLNWQVQNATTFSIDQGVGAVTGTSKAVTVTATTIYTLTATNADGSTTATTAIVIGQNPSMVGDRWVHMVSPTSAETFLGPTTLRLIAAAHDPNISTNMPAPGLGGNAQKVQFFVDDAVVLEEDGANAEYWYFKGFITGVAEGAHRVWARAIYTKPDLVLDSPPALITVVAPPTYDMTVSLDADVSLAGAQGYELVGSAGKRIRLNGNGHRILSATGASGPLTLKFVDAFDLGSTTDTTQSSFEVTTTGPITIEDSAFDTSNTIRLAAGGAAPVSIRRNLFRSNMRMPLGQNPASAVTGASYPSIRLSGLGTGPKVFAANNTAAGWVQLEKTTNWVVGGDTDADSNVLIGPRVGIYAQTTSNSQVRRNYSHHVYYGGWSQGSNFELGGSATTVVEHNVIYDSSWPVRGAGCEFRYNLVADAGHEFIWPETGGSIHHNIFEGGNSDIASIFVINKAMGVKVFNNTIDGQLYKDMVTAVSITAGSEMSLTSNAILNVPKPLGVAAGASVTIAGTLTADYNAFGNVQKIDYSDARHPAHDVVLASAADAMLTELPATSFDIDEATIWKRTTTVRDILTRYRMRYLPKAGSPLIDKGDPAGGDGNDIGAVGAGTPNAADKFGLF
jgi:hypothetical protein